MTQIHASPASNLAAEPTTNAPPVLRSYSRVVQDDVDQMLTSLRRVLPAFSGTTLLVTGAGGFLMSYIVELLLAWNARNAGRPCRVVALDNFKTGVPERLAHLEGLENFRILRRDVTEPMELDDRVDWIVHGASIASPTVYRKYPLETISANVVGTQRILELARRDEARGVVVMSTSEIYGDPDRDAIPTPEDYRGYVSCTGPRACYDESKRMAETLAVTYHRLFGTPIKIIRPFNVYGPGLRLDDRRVLPDFMGCVLRNEPIELLSDGAPTRSFCYVSDAIDLLIRALAADFVGDAINVGNDEVEISMLDLAHVVARAGAAVLDRPRIEVHRKRSDDIDYLIDNPQRRCPDLTRARGLFADWSPKVRLEEGVTKLFHHYVEKSED